MKNGKISDKKSFLAKPVVSKDQLNKLKSLYFCLLQCKKYQVVKIEYEKHIIIMLRLFTKKRKRTTADATRPAHAALTAVFRTTASAT